MCLRHVAGFERIPRLAQDDHALRQVPMPGEPRPAPRELDRRIADHPGSRARRRTLLCVGRVDLLHDALQKLQVKQSIAISFPYHKIGFGHGLLFKELIE